ncbi:MAG: MFS transporter [Anaerolineae bacterium]|nr:MFS transporter [Anaerolineae bacterium]
MSATLTGPQSQVTTTSDEFVAPPGRWRSLTAMAIAFVVDNQEGGLINVLFPVIMAALALPLSALGVLSSLSRFARMIFGPLWAIAADKYGRKRVLFIVTGAWGIWTILAGFAQSYTQLLILYTIGVAGTVGAEPIVQGMVPDLFKDEERGKAFGTIRSTAGLGGLILTPLIGQLANVENGWRIGMFIMGAIAIVSGVLILFMVHEPKRAAGPGHSEAFDLKAMRGLLKTPTILLMAGTIVFVTLLVLQSFFVTYFVKVRGFETPAAAWLMTVWLGGFMISSLAGGLLGDWFEQRFGPKGRIMMYQIYCVVFAVMAYLTMQVDWGHGPVIYGLSFLFGLVSAVGFSGAIAPMVSAVVPRALSATAFGLLFALIQGLVSALLSLFAGNLAEQYGLSNVMFWMITVPYAVNAVYWFLFYPYYPKDVAAQKARDAALKAA